MPKDIPPAIAKKFTSGLNYPGMIFAAISALSYGIADFSGGLASRKSPVSAVAAWSQAVGILIAIIAVPVIGGSLPLRRHGSGVLPQDSQEQRA